MSATKYSFEYSSTQGGNYTSVNIIKSLKQSNESLASEDSGRTDNGVMHISWIKQNIRRWDIELRPCTASEVSALLTAIQGKDYYVNIFDITSGTVVNGLHVYTSNTTSNCYSGVLNSNGLYTGVSFSIIEMGD